MLIVGCGIAGQALAPMLARTGVAVDVIEREPAWRHAGAGIYLPGNAARALRALGLEAQLGSGRVSGGHASAVDCMRASLRANRTRLLRTTNRSAAWPDPVHPVLRHDV
ncbi:MAG: FAD-dependent monooxygenase [Solirubrobacteraceae bacterium]